MKKEYQLQRIDGQMIYSAETNSWKECVEKAVQEDIDLSYAHLANTDLRAAKLTGARLHGVCLEGADLYMAHLQNADLSAANLKYVVLVDADLRNANLSGAVLINTVLRGADLRGADLDYSMWFFGCETFGCIADERLAAQLAYHFCRINFQACPEAEDVQKILKSLGNKFHRAFECGKL